MKTYGKRRTGYPERSFYRRTANFISAFYLMDTSQLSCGEYRSVRGDSLSVFVLGV